MTELMFMEQASYVEINNKLDTLIKMLEVKDNTSISSNEWLTGQDVMKQLNISSRTLQNYRNKGMVGFVKIGRKIMYKKSDISAFLEKFHHEPYLEKKKEVRRRVFNQKIKVND